MEKKKRIKPKKIMKNKDLKSQKQGNISFILFEL